MEEEIGSVPNLIGFYSVNMTLEFLKTSLLALHVYFSMKKEKKTETRRNTIQDTIWLPIDGQTVGTRCILYFEVAIHW